MDTHATFFCPPLSKARPAGRGATRCGCRPLRPRQGRPENVSYAAELEASCQHRARPCYMPTRYAVVVLPEYWIGSPTSRVLLCSRATTRHAHFAGPKGGHGAGSESSFDVGSVTLEVRLCPAVHAASFVVRVHPNYSGAQAAPLPSSLITSSDWSTRITSLFSLRDR